MTIGAASRDQARIAFERMRGFAEHPLADLLTIRHLELRAEDSKLPLSSTAAAQLDSPLGRMRAHALANRPRSAP